MSTLHVLHSSTALGGLVCPVAREKGFDYRRSITNLVRPGHCGHLDASRLSAGYLVKLLEIPEQLARETLQTLLSDGKVRIDSRTHGAVRLSLDGV